MYILCRICPTESEAGQSASCGLSQDPGELLLCCLTKTPKISEIFPKIIYENFLTKNLRSGICGLSQDPGELILLYCLTETQKIFETLSKIVYENIFQIDYVNVVSPNPKKYLRLCPKPFVNAESKGEDYLIFSEGVFSESVFSKSVFSRSVFYDSVFFPKCIF